MKTPEDEAFDELARKQGAWGGGYRAKKAMAADKLQGPVANSFEEYCKTLHPLWNTHISRTYAEQFFRAGQSAQPAQEPVAQWLEDAFREGWEAYRESEFASKITEDWAFGNSFANCRMIDLQQNTPPQPAQEPVAWMFQHEDTGLIECVDAQQVEWGFEKNNPRWQKIGPLYTTPPLPVQPAQEPYDQTALELCDVCGWKTLIPDDGCLNCERTQPAQEPVARVSGVYGGRFTYEPINRAMVLPVGMALYAAAQRPWVGLTDADIERIKLMTYEKETNADGEEQEAVNIDWLIKTAEHFCKEKNNG